MCTQHRKFAFFALSALSLAACASTATVVPTQNFVVPPSALDGHDRTAGSGTVRGAALMQAGHDAAHTQVVVSIFSAPPGTVVPWHVHAGRCGDSGAVLGDPSSYPVPGGGCRPEISARHRGAGRRDVRERKLLRQHPSLAVRDEHHHRLRQPRLRAALVRGLLSVPRRDHGLDPAADVEVPDDLHPARRTAATRSSRIRFTARS